MDKTRHIDFKSLGLRDALDLAALVEEEARDRYEEFADQMDQHRNPDAAGFFRFMLGIEAMHARRLNDRRKKLFGDAPRAVTPAMIFDVEAPDYDEARATMSVRQALAASLRAEQKAFAFFDGALAHVADDEVRELFSELREDEREHQTLVERQIAKLPADPLGTADDYDDGPVAQ